MPSNEKSLKTRPINTVETSRPCHEPVQNRLSKRLVLLAVPVCFLYGCSTGKVVTPPYFKDIYQTTHVRPAVEPGASPEVAGGKNPVPETKNAVVKLVSIPNPLKKETVTVSLDKAKGSPGKTGEAAPAEVEKPQTLTTQVASGDVQLIVENMPIYEFVNMVFGDLLKVNYTVASDVQFTPEKITLNMNRKMTGKEFFPFAVGLLRKNNLEIREDGGVLYVTRQGKGFQDPVGANTEVYVGSLQPNLPPHKKVTLILAPDYVPASQILVVAKQLQMITDEVRAEYLQSSQAVALVGTVASLERIANLFKQLDRTTFAQRSFELVYLDYMNVTEFEKKLKEVLPTIGIPVARNVNDPGLLTIPFEKINALLVASSQKAWLDVLLSWKEKLDAPESMGDETQFFVFQPRNRPAEELVEVLKSVSSGGNVPQAGPATPGQQKQLAATASSPRVEGGNTTAVPGKGFTAILDKGRNAVVVSATPANYKLIRSILTQLDTPPRQVLIEATIMEVTLTDSLAYGVEWYIKHNSGDFQGTVSTLGNLALGANGLNYAITKLSGDFQAKVNMFASKNLINIVSTPHIAMLDGKEATINVGTEVPIVTAETSAADINGTTTTTGQPSILRNVQYRNTGTILRVKPVINSEGALTIDINQELSEAQTNSVSNIDSPLILNRSIHTTLSCKSGETVLLGGLISTNKSRGESKVPILGDIPLIGNLFKTTSTGATKTELIVEITPYILNDMEQLDDITKKFKDGVFLQN